MRKEGRVRVRQVEKVYPFIQVLILDGFTWERAILLSSEEDRHKISYKGREFYRVTKELQTIVIEYVVEEDFHNPTGTVFFPLKYDQWQEVLDKWEELYAPIDVPFEVKLTCNPKICNCQSTAGFKDCRCNIEIAELILEENENENENNWEEALKEYRNEFPKSKLDISVSLLKYLKENYYAPKRIKEAKETNA